MVVQEGHLPFEQDAANLFFQLVSSRYEHASLVLTSNLPFSGWGGVFGDQAVAAAMIDRIVHHADVLTRKGAKAAAYRARSPRNPILRGRGQAACNSIESPAQGSGKSRRRKSRAGLPTDPLDIPTGLHDEPLHPPTERVLRRCLPSLAGALRCRCEHNNTPNKD